MVIYYLVILRLTPKKISVRPDNIITIEHGILRNSGCRDTIPKTQPQGETLDGIDRALASIVVGIEYPAAPMLSALEAV